MTNALTATKTSKLSSQGVPDVIFVLNKEEKRSRHKQKKNEEEQQRKRSARTSKGTCTCTRSSTSKGTHKQKGTCSYTKSILYHCRQNGIQKNNNMNSRTTNAACCQSSIVSPGFSKTIPNILKVSSRVPQTQNNSH